MVSHIENAGFVNCRDKVHEDFDLLNTEEAFRIPVRGLAQAMKGIVEKGGMPGLETIEDAERLEKGMEDEFNSGQITFGMQVKQVWGRKPE